VGDVSTEGSAVAWKVRLDPKITKGGRGGVAFLVAGVREELRSYFRWKRRARESLEARSPLFQSNQRRRLCLRQIQVLFRKWQIAAGFETLYPFHALRHSAITNVYRATRDLYLTQRFARHSSPLTTTCYTHPSDEELYEGIRGIKT
jgi:site-specific recombinase XerC